MKGFSQSPTRQELQAFETLLDGTGAQMPNRSQLLATLSATRCDSFLPIPFVLLLGIQRLPYEAINDDNIHFKVIRRLAA